MKLKSSRKAYRQQKKGYLVTEDKRKKLCLSSIPLLETRLPGPQ